LSERIAGRVDVQNKPTIAFLDRGRDRGSNRPEIGPRRQDTDKRTRKWIEAVKGHPRDELARCIIVVDGEIHGVVRLGLRGTRGGNSVLAESLTGGWGGSRGRRPGASGRLGISIVFLRHRR